MKCWVTALMLMDSSTDVFRMSVSLTRHDTSLADKAERKSLMVGLTLHIVLRLTLIAGTDPPDMTVTFFGIIPPPRGVATVVPVNFA